MEIKKVTLMTKSMLEMRSFYVELLGFTLINEDINRFRIAAGTSELEFISREVVGQPYYHFAFNIPANKFEESKLWIKERVSLLVEEGNDEVNFVDLSAHALYFYDPAGNIVEFISRHSVSVDSTQPFSIESIINIGEISLTVEDAITASEKLNNIGLTERDNHEISTKTLNFLGERTKGVFVLLTEPGRRWLFSDKMSVVYPIEITLENKHRIVVNTDKELQVYTN